MLAGVIPFIVSISVAAAATVEWIPRSVKTEPVMKSPEPSCVRVMEVTAAVEAQRLEPK